MRADKRWRTRKEKKEWGQVAHIAVAHICLPLANVGLMPFLPCVNKSRSAPGFTALPCIRRPPIFPLSHFREPLVTFVFPPLRFFSRSLPRRATTLLWVKGESCVSSPRRAQRTGNLFFDNSREVKDPPSAGTNPVGPRSHGVGDQYDLYGKYDNKGYYKYDKYDKFLRQNGHFLHLSPTRTNGYV